MAYWLRIVCFCSLLSVVAEAADPIQEGDRVLLVGNTFFERDTLYGHLETAIAIRYPEYDLTFRNLGWSGDNVFGESRAYFGRVEDGYKHLIRHVEELKPSVVLVNYGANAAYAGAEGLPAFIAGYHRLLEDVEKTTKRIVLLSPVPCESLGSPLPDMEAQNERVLLYVNAIKTLADERGVGFVDLFQPVQQLPGPLTDNGIHFTESGYRQVGEAMAQEITGKPRPERSDEESILQAILKKKLLFFYHFRPQNETYLRGFRKHEQGRNAVEITRLAELAAEQDKVIHTLLKGGVK
jgi:lysophospholipase L1-like esterase